MNLTKLFNFIYFKENVKKSKSVIFLLMVILPMFTVLQLMNDTYTDVFAFQTLGIINVFMTYLIPVLLSISLFGWVYKRKSVDFMGSMPISRSTIFTTNTIGGIGLILLVQFVTFLLTLIMGQFTNGVIFLELAFDIFVYQSLAYIFIFTISNLAMSVSGNIITSLAVMVLIFAIYPACSFYINEASDSLISMKYLNTYYEKDFYRMFSIPITIIAEQGAPYILSVIKTIILSMLYAVLGLFCFKDRKMEKAGESFFSEKAHFVIKGLTLIPFVMLSREIFTSMNFSELCLLIAIILVYWYVYDLLTAKKVKLTKNLISLVASFVSIFLILEVGMFAKETYIMNIDASDIEYVTLTVSSYSTMYEGSSFYPMEIEKDTTYKITDKNAIRDLVNYVDEVAIKRREGEYVVEGRVVNYSMKGYLGKNEHIDFNNVVGDEYIKEIIKKYGIVEEEKFEFADNATCFHDYRTITKEEREKIIELASTLTPVSIRTNRENIGGYNMENLWIFHYKNHQVQMMSYELSQNKELNNLVNEVTKRELKYNMEENEISDIEFRVELAPNSQKAKFDYYVWDEYEALKMKENIEQFFSGEVDYEKDVVHIRFSFNDVDMTINIRTNDYDGVLNFIKQYGRKDGINYYQKYYEDVYYDDTTSFPSTEKVEVLERVDTEVIEAIVPGEVIEESVIID